MKFKKRIPLLLSIAIATTGCQQMEPTTQKTEQEPTNNKTIPFKPTEQKKTVKNRPVQAIKITEAPDHISHPADAVLHQYEVMFENGDSQFPKESDLISESTLGKNSIVAIRSPEGIHKYAILLYAFEKHWFIDGMLRLGFSEKNFETDTKGLALPMKAFNTVKIVIRDEKEVWAFVDQERVITIARINQYPFTENPETKKIVLKNGVTAHLSTDRMNQDFLYYFDTNKIIVVSGNIREAELMELANSLPSALSATFPFTRGKD